MKVDEVGVGCVIGWCREWSLAVNGEICGAMHVKHYILVVTLFVTLYP